MGRALTVALLAALAALLTGCGNDPRYSLAMLERLPEARLFAPGSEALSGDRKAVGYGTNTGPSPAYTTAILGSPTAVDDVEAFYRRELQASGWSPHTGTDFVGLAGAERTTLWRKGDLGFQLTILRKDGEYSRVKPQQYTTYYAIAVSEILRP